MKIRIPATTANVGCGYDTFGMALSYYNHIECAEADVPCVHISGYGEQYLPRDERNLMLRAAKAVYDTAGRGPLKLSLTVRNNIPLSRGMGSSSAAIVGGLYSANQMLGQPLTTEKLLEIATEMEGHPDNVAPALLGGFLIIVRERKEQRVKRIEPPVSLMAVLAVPDFSVSTARARAILPRMVPLTDAVYNVSHAAMLAVCLADGDLPGFGDMLKDRLHQPYRFGLIPGAKDVAAAAVSKGALGCVISGSGPTMIAFCSGGKELCTEIGHAMRQAFAAHRVEAQIINVAPDNRGTHIEKE
ncbi:MAG: homoserine kinase [Clostridiales bacterium]|nr:homoserine kinase [Clostridiales bacterium]